MSDNGACDEKIIAIPCTDPNYNTYHSINDLPKHIFDEMQHFFSVYKQLEEKLTSVDVIMDKDEALKIIQQSMDNYQKNIVNLKKR